MRIRSKSLIVCGIIVALVAVVVAVSRTAWFDDITLGTRYAYVRHFGTPTDVDRFLDDLGSRMAEIRGDVETHARLVALGKALQAQRDLEALDPKLADRVIQVAIQDRDLMDAEQAQAEAETAAYFEPPGD